jgi:hypothetical protein
MPVELTEVNLPPNPELAPTVPVSAVVEVDEIDLTSTSDTPDAYEGVDWSRLPTYQRPYRELKGVPSWLSR